MPPMLFAAAWDMWYALPLLLVVSLVYAATRHEAMPDIVESAGRNAIWIGGFLLVVLGVLFVVANYL
jgi:uncharacterized membrane protein